MSFDMSAKVPFTNRILVLGCGSVAQCLLPLLLRHFEVSPSRITVIDQDQQKSARIATSVLAGVRFVHFKVTAANFEGVLSEFLQSGDLFIDLAWNIETAAILDWCHHRGVLFLNTSIEEWDPYEKTGGEQTLYARHMKIRRLVAAWRDPFEGPTAVIDHGANPGLVSHLTKQALIEIAERILFEKPTDKRVPALFEALKKKQFNHMAMLTGVKVIHVSERDTQVSSVPKRLNEFVNTWSVEGLHEEGVAPAELGWGTHEQRLPWDARGHRIGPRNQIYLDNHRGMDTWVKSWVPDSQIHGMVIRHGEAFSLSEYLSVTDESRHVIYRPTVHYAYCPCDAAIASLHELRMLDLELQESTRIMFDEVIDGADILGCLLMGHDFGAWWIGSRLDIHQTRQLVEGQNSTTLQVAASMLGAITWMLRHPNRGVNLPDYLPHEDVLQVARPYLGELISAPCAWRPQPRLPADSDEKWQFESFLVDRSAAISPEYEWRDSDSANAPRTKVRLGREPESLPTGAQGTMSFMAAGWT